MMTMDDQRQQREFDKFKERAGYTTINIGEVEYTMAMEYSSGLVIYVGLAVSGTDKGATGWQIRKIVYSGVDATDVQWADGVTTFTKVWNDRASYSYS